MVAQPYFGPATPALLRVLSGAQWPGVGFEYAVEDDARPCAFCVKPFVEVQGGTGLNATLGIDDTAPAGERLRWYHGTCALKASSAKLTGMAVGMRGRSAGFTNPEQPTCARCGEPWSEHGRYGWDTRQCEDGGCYHSSFARIGVVSPAWVRVAA